jgi:hypothetical protein
MMRLESLLLLKRLLMPDTGLIIAGKLFSERDTHFRICYTVPDEKLKARAELLCRLAGLGT